MEQKDFQRILERYLQGQASVEERRMIDSWYEAMGKDHHSLSDNQEKLELEKTVRLAVAAHIQSTKRIDSGSFWLRNRRVNSRYSIGIAATILLFILSYIYVTNRNESSQDRLASVPAAASLTWTQRRPARAKL